MHITYGPSDQSPSLDGDWHGQDTRADIDLQHEDDGLGVVDPRLVVPVLLLFHSGDDTEPPLHLLPRAKCSQVLCPGPVVLLP